MYYVSVDMDPFNPEVFRFACRLCERFSPCHKPYATLEKIALAVRAEHTFSGDALITTAAHRTGQVPVLHINDLTFKVTKTKEQSRGTHFNEWA